MAEEKILLDALSSSDFKVSIHDKKRTDAKETKIAIENKQQKFGEELNPEASNDKNDDKRSLLSIVKGMSAIQLKNVIESLKQNGLDGPLTKEQIVQNAFTVEKTIRENA